MQDNETNHKAHKITRWFQIHGIEVLPDQPPYSPYLNPIEHLWLSLEQGIYDVCPHFDSIAGPEAQRAKLEEVLPQAWHAIRDEYVTSVLESMPRRMQAVIDAEGWQTKY